MSMGTQHFRQFPEPYDEIFFPDGMSYGFMNGREATLQSVLSSITDEELRRRTRVYMEMYHEIHQDFVALGLSKVLPRWLRFLVQSKVDRFVANGVMFVGPPLCCPNLGSRAFHDVQTTTVRFSIGQRRPVCCAQLGLQQRAASVSDVARARTSLVRHNRFRRAAASQGDTGTPHRGLRSSAP